MKLRHDRGKCERCKRPLFAGQHAVKIYGRYWHTGCAVAYKRARALRVAA